MAGYRKKNADGPNSEDKALDLFAEMIIEKIEGIQKDWKSLGLRRVRYSGPATFTGASTTG